jgi:hypothetical protein
VQGRLAAMADQPMVHIGENSPEHVAYRLMQLIADVEQVNLHLSDPGKAGWCWRDPGVDPQHLRG